MDSPYARRPRPAGPPRAERLRRERTARQLRRQAVLEGEVREQLERGLGPGGGPVGEPARAAWRRSRARAYLALPPWSRAWRTWCAWGYLRRLLIVLVVAVAWTVLALPLRSAGLATYRTSEIGFAAVAAAAPLLALAPPGRRGRFARPIPDRPPWGRSRPAATLRRAAALAAVAGGGVLLGLAAAGPGVDEAGLGRKTTAHHLADERVVHGVLTTLCGGPVTTGTRWLGGDRYAAKLRGGGEAVVDVAARRVEGPAPRC